MSPTKEYDRLINEEMRKEPDYEGGSEEDLNKVCRYSPIYLIVSRHPTTC